jgi:hypothetical protein
MSLSDQTSAPLVAEPHHNQLRHCRALLRELDPNHAPGGINRKEFRWQYQALRERTQVFASCIAQIEAEEPTQSNLMALRKAANAIKMSLQYFDDVLTPKHHSDEESTIPIQGEI